MAILAVSYAAKHPGDVNGDTSADKGTYEKVTKAINKEDWKSLRELVKKGMKANGYISNWMRSPLRVGKLIRVENEFKLEGKTCKRFSFALHFKDGRKHPHLFQVMVGEEGGKSSVLDFWEFGW